MNLSNLSINQRLRLFLDTLEIGQKDFAQKTNISQQVLSNALNGKTRYLKSDFISKILNVYPQLNLRWLFLGKGNMIIQPEMTKEDWQEFKIKLLEENAQLKNEIIDLLKHKNQILEPVS